MRIDGDSAEEHFYEALGDSPHPEFLFIFRTGLISSNARAMAHSEIQGVPGLEQSRLGHSDHFSAHNPRNDFSEQHDKKVAKYLH
jgi:hypothetical protein